MNNLLLYILYTLNTNNQIFMDNNGTYTIKYIKDNNKEIYQIIYTYNPHITKVIYQCNAKDWNILKLLYDKLEQLNKHNNKQLNNCNCQTCKYHK